MPANDGAAVNADTPGTTSTSKPCWVRNSSSSPPRPNTSGSPLLSRTTGPAASRSRKYQAWISASNSSCWPRSLRAGINVARGFASARISGAHEFVINHGFGLRQNPRRLSSSAGRGRLDPPRPDTLLPCPPPWRSPSRNTDKQGGSSEGSDQVGCQTRPAKIGGKLRSVRRLTRGSINRTAGIGSTSCEESSYGLNNGNHHFRPENMTISASAPAR